MIFTADYWFSWPILIAITQNPDSTFHISFYCLLLTPQMFSILCTPLIFLCSFHLSIKKGKAKHSIFHLLFAFLLPICLLCLLFWLRLKAISTLLASAEDFASLHWAITVLVQLHSLYFSYKYALCHHGNAAFALR